MNPALPGEARATGRRLDPKYAPLLIPAVMAAAMSILVASQAQPLVSHLTGAAPIATGASPISSTTRSTRS